MTRIDVDVSPDGEERDAAVGDAEGSEVGTREGEGLDLGRVRFDGGLRDCG